MSTCRLIVSKALRKIGRLGAGREPRVADQADVLTALQGLYSSWVQSGAFGRLADVIPKTDYTAGENQRIVRDSDTIVITLPEYVPAYSNPLPYNLERDPYLTNYEAVDGRNRPPRDGAVVQIKDRVAGNTETWIYDGHRRDWINIDALQLDETAPRSVTDPEGLSACLALEIADDFGAEVGPTTQAQAMRFRVGLVSNFSTPREVVAGVYA